MTLLKGSWSSPPAYPYISQKHARQPLVTAGCSRGLALKAACTAILLALTLTAAWAQSTATGTVSGLVTDPSNAVITGAAVRLVDAATNTARDTTTNDAGRYIFVNVTPGAYDIKISRARVAQAGVSHVVVDIRQVSTTTPP